MITIVVVVASFPYILLSIVRSVLGLVIGHNQSTEQVGNGIGSFYIRRHTFFINKLHI